MFILAYIPPIAVIVLTIRYVRLPLASNRAKWTVGCCAAVSLLIYWRLPMWVAVGLLLQVAICIYLIFYNIIFPSNK